MLRTILLLSLLCPLTAQADETQDYIDRLMNGVRQNSALERERQQQALNDVYDVTYRAYSVPVVVATPIVYVGRPVVLQPCYPVINPWFGFGQFCW